MTEQSAATRAETLIDLIADHLGRDREKVADTNAKLVDDLGADSLDSVEIEMAIEDEFDLPHDALRDAIKKDGRVRDVIDAVEKALKS